MLQVAYIKNNKDHVLKGLAVRNFADAEAIVNQVIEMDEKRKATQTELDTILADSNKISKEIGLLFKSGEHQKATILKKKTGELKERSKFLNEKLSSILNELNELLYQIPNIPNVLVPPGTTEADNQEVFIEGKIPTLHDGALPHWELAKKYDIIDFELGNKITGAGFPVYKGKGAKLQRALINYFLDKNTEVGYQEVQVPYLVNEASGFGTGQLPDKEGQMYHAILHTGYTPCFRREAGSYGAHVRGLNRLHQFDKVEIVRIEHPEKSYEALDEMVDHVKEILRELKLPYRILRLCGGDIGFTSTLTYDFEVFSTAQNRWLEISSISNFETFQANRLKLRFKNADGKSELAHTLNGSSLALPRVLAGILENYQTKEGILIPEVLQKYTGFEIIN
jgi:seryl-tRNA synthetase